MVFVEFIATVSGKKYYFVGTSLRDILADTNEGKSFDDIELSSYREITLEEARALRLVYLEEGVVAARGRGVSYCLDTLDRGAVQGNWEGMLHNRPHIDLVGSDLETEEEGRILRGPIAKAYLRGDTIYLERLWTAERRQDGTWVKSSAINLLATVAHASQPSDIGGGRKRFSARHIGVGIIYLKSSGDKLDPNLVDGLSEEFKTPPLH